MMLKRGGRCCIWACCLVICNTCVYLSLGGDTCSWQESKGGGGGMIYIKSLSAVESGISSKVKGIVVGMVNGYSQV